jgi:hypothetical protein
MKENSDEQREWLNWLNWGQSWRGGEGTGIFPM